MVKGRILGRIQKMERILKYFNGEGGSSCVCFWNKPFNFQKVEVIFLFCFWSVNVKRGDIQPKKKNYNKISLRNKLRFGVIQEFFFQF